MYLQYRSSCALMETKTLICFCMHRKGVNLFGSLSKITICACQESMRAVLSVVCPPSWPLCFYSVLSWHLKELTAGQRTVYWEKGITFGGISLSSNQ